MMKVAVFSTSSRSIEQRTGGEDTTVENVSLVYISHTLLHFFCSGLIVVNEKYCWDMKEGNEDGAFNSLHTLDT